MKPNTPDNDEHKKGLSMNITNKEIVDYYRGKKIDDADKLLLDTARNNFKQGYTKAMKDKNMLLKKNYALGEEYGRKKALDIIKDAIFLCTIGNSNNVDRLRLLKEIAKLESK